MIKELKKLLKQHNIESFIIPSQDEFLNEYVPEDAKRLEYVTGFKGSAGIAIITRDKNAFFTDGRYILQAEKEIDSSLFEIFDIATKKPYEWLKNNNIKNVGFDPWLHSEKSIQKYQNPKPVPNLVDMIWSDRKKNNQSIIKAHKKEYAGTSSIEKIKNILNDNQEADYILLTQPESICWLLNIRGNDVEYNPIILCYAFLDKNGRVKLFHKNELKNKPELKNVEFYHLREISNFIETIKNKLVMLDDQASPLWFIDRLKNIIRKEDPCTLPKAIKNKNEIEGAIKTHIYDGIALINFLYFLENSKKLTEMDAAEKVLFFRQKNPLFQTSSFETIAGYGPNGAIIHYKANEKTNKTIGKDNLFLLDSGGQYLSGTTDITRTIHLGKPTREQVKYYTLVLKGHINLASIVFPSGTSGSQLDILARMHLWKINKDYNHGTGHGVGSYLNVHEGPQRIGKYSDIALVPGMIISNEPGFYQKNSFGIRLENLVLVTQDSDKFLKFKTLSLVPFEKKLIDLTMMTKDEISWINEYHNEIFKTISKDIQDNQLVLWLKKKCEKL